jgi:hypothetical protein
MGNPRIDEPQFQKGSAVWSAPGEVADSRGDQDTDWSLVEVRDAATLDVYAVEFIGRLDAGPHDALGPIPDP